MNSPTSSTSASTTTQKQQRQQKPVQQSIKTTPDLLTEKNLYYHDRMQCDEEVSKMERVGDFIQDQLPFMQNKAHYEELKQNNELDEDLDQQIKHDAIYKVSKAKDKLSKNDRLYDTSSQHTSLFLKNYFKKTTSSSSCQKH